MNRILESAAYSFDASAKTITFSGFTPELKKVFVIINKTRSNTIIYSSTDSTKSGSIAGQILTLAFDTTSHADTDELMVRYWDKDFINKIDDASIVSTLSSLLTELQLKADLSETQPVSAVSLPLPTGASTSANQSTIITALSALLTELQLKGDLSETQPVSAASLPLPTGASTSANQSTIITALSALLTELQLKGDLSETQPVSAASLPLPTGASTSANQSTIITALSSLLTELQLKADFNETQPVSAVSLPLPTGASTSANQSTIITALSALLTELQLKGDLSETQPVSAASLPLPTGASTSANQSTIITNLGALTETAPASDTASSGLNGRLQRIAQRLTSLLTELQLKADLSETQPVSAASLPLPTGASTSANQSTIITALSSLLTELQLKADFNETQPTNNVSNASGGASLFSLVCAASNNATVIKASAGKVYNIQAFNIGTANVYLKFYNKATSPSPASDSVVKSILIPADGSGVSISLGVGSDFSTGIAIAVVTGISNTDNSSVNANEIIINIDFK